MTTIKLPSSKWEFDDFVLVGEASNGIDAIELCTQAKPDVVLMDLKMPIMDGITATQIIGQKFPSIRVIAITSFDDEPLGQSAQQALYMIIYLKCDDR